MNGLRGLAATVTPTGRGVAAATVVLAVLAGVLRFPELAVLAVAGLLALAVATAVVARVPEIEATIEVRPDRVGRGEPALATVVVRNTGGRTARRLSVRVPHGETATDSLVRAVAVRETHRLDVPVPTDRRGTFQVGPVDVSRGDVFGLLVRTRRLGEPAMIHVYPNAFPLEPLPSVRSSSPDGLAADSIVTGGVTFHALREYVPGDDPRHVHWRSSAKAGTLLVRLNVDPSRPVTTVLLDTRRAAYPHGPGGADADTAFDDAVEVAASILLAATRRRFPVRLCTTGDVRVAGRGGRAGRGEEALLLDTLSATTLDDLEVERGGRGDPAQATQRLTETVRSIRGGATGTLALVTGPLEAGQLAAVGPAVGRYEHVVVVRAGAGTTSAAVPRPDGGATTAGGSRLRVIDVDGARSLLAAWPAGATGRAR